MVAHQHNVTEEESEGREQESQAWEQATTATYLSEGDSPNQI